MIIFATLAKRWRQIAKSDVLVAYHDYGFGFTIHGVDAVRRLYPGQKITVLFLFQRTRYNPLVATIWPDVTLIFLPIEFAWGTPGHYRKLPWFLGLKSPWLYHVLKRLFSGKIVLGQFDIDAQVHACGKTSVDRSPAVHWIAGYANLMDTVSAPSPRLPTSLKRRVELALARCAPRHIKLCCLYLRVRGDMNDVDPSSWRRIGSPLRSYWATIQLLNNRGYTVLLVGDRLLDAETKDRFGEGIFDAPSLGLSHDLLYLFAALESNVAVMECGGGSWLPIYRNIPHIVVNVLPFIFASPGGTVYFKSIFNKQGVAEDPRSLLGCLAEEYDFHGYVVKDNSAEELGEAVADFLDHLNEPRPWGVAARELVELPLQSWHRVMRSGISPVWLRRYGAAAPERAELGRSLV